ncbi:hypothetical protein ACKWRH_06505 [Bradyrhizobium sp. Pa8]|uniref:hypothetical protein n=1 Tax=Bradyrhizobium sp. Pa8 TaxID=3386552 RepID=UPI00403F2F79
MDNSRVDHSNHVMRNPRIRVVPSNTQFDDEEVETPPLKRQTMEERDAEIRTERVWPSERKYLALFYLAKDAPLPSCINGAGHEAPRRLKARGFLKQVGESKSDYFAVWKITPEGEAAWLAMLGQTKD